MSINDCCCCKQSNSKYINSLSDDAIIVDSYNGYNFSFYYFYEDVFYLYNGVQYMRLPILENRKGEKFVILWDDLHNPIHVKYNLFKWERELM